VYQYPSSAVTPHVSILAAGIESRGDAYSVIGTLVACILFAFLYNWQTTRNSKAGYQRFINWTSAQRAEAQRRRRPSPVAVETSRRAKTWSTTGWALGLVSFGFGLWGVLTSTTYIKWPALAIFGVTGIITLVLDTVGIYLGFKAAKQQRQYDELRSP
jgi:hypothetical protein